MLNLKYEWPYQFCFALVELSVFIIYQLFVRMFILYEYCFMFVWEIVAKHFIVSSLRKKHNSIALSCL